MVFTPRHEDIFGSNLNGTDGDKNRTYTVANTGLQAAQLQIIVASAILQNGIHFSVSGDIITFLKYVWDNQPITLDYNTSGSTSGATYTNTLCVVQNAGLGVEVFNEDLGLGTGVLKSFDVANGNIIDGSYDLKYAPASGTNTNDFTSLIESTHYTLDKDGGSILLTTAGLAELGVNELYIDYIHSPKISNTILETYITPASEEVDKITGNYWGPVKSSTELQDGRDDYKYPETDQPYVLDYDEPDNIQLKYLSVQSITSITFITGTSTRELDSDNFRWDEDGFITLTVDRLPPGRLNVSTIYTHGYDETPALVKELTSIMVAIRAYVYISGGSYDDATSFTLGRKSVTIGEAWVNIREVIAQANKRKSEILNTLGPKMDVF